MNIIQTLRIASMNDLNNLPKDKKTIQQLEISNIPISNEQFLNLIEGMQNLKSVELKNCSSLFGRVEGRGLLETSPGQFFPLTSLKVDSCAQINLRDLQYYVYNCPSVTSFSWNGNKYEDEKLESLRQEAAYETKLCNDARHSLTECSTM